MTVPLRVLGDRVLVKPDVQTNAPEQTESGVYVAATMAAAVSGADPTTSVHRGTVMAVGTPVHPLKHETEVLVDKLFAYYDSYDNDYVTPLALEAADLLCDLVRRVPCVAVGDDVLFSSDAGQETTLDGDTYVILHEHELLAVIDPTPTYAYPVDADGRPVTASQETHERHATASHTA